MDIGTIEAALKLRDDASAAIARFQKNLGKIGTTSQEVASSLTRIGLALTAGVVVPFGAVLKVTKDFQSAFANVVKTVEGFDVDAFGRLNEEAQAFRDQLLDLSRVIPSTADDLANIAAVGGQFGVAQKDLLGFTETVAKLGVAVDGIEAETAAAALAQIANVTREGEGAFKRYADVLVDLGNKGNSTEGEILEFAKRLAGAGAQAKLSGDEIFGLGAAMANVGLNAEAGGTAMSRLLSNMSKAGAEGEQASQKFADFAGKVDATVASGGKFAELFKRDASQALTLFFDGLSKAAAQGENMSAILTELGVNEVRQRDTVSRLAGAQGELAKQFRNAAQAAQEGTALNEEARKKYTTFDNQLKLFMNTVRLVAIEIGTPLLNGLNQVLKATKPLQDAVVGLARSFEHLEPSTQAIVALLGLGAGLTGILTLLAGQAVRTAGDMAKLIDVMKTMLGLQAGVTLANTASGITAVGAASAGTARSAIVLTDAWKDQLSTAGKVGGATAGVGAAAAVTVGQITLLTGISYALSRAMVEVNERFFGIGRGLSELQKQFVTLGGMLNPGLTPALQRDVALWSDLIDAAKGYFAEVGKLPAVAPPGVGGKRTKDINLDETAMGHLPTFEEALALSQGAEKVQTRIDALKAALAALSPETKRTIDEWKSFGYENEKIAKELRLSEEVVTAYVAKAGQAAAAQKTLAKESEQVANGVLSARMAVAGIAADLDAMFDKMEADRVKEVKEAFLDLNMAVRKTSDAVKLRAATEGMSKEFKDLAKTTVAWTRELEDLQHAADTADPELKAVYDRLIELKQTEAAGEIADLVIQTDEFYDVLLAVNPQLAEMIRLAKQEGEATTTAAEKTKDWTSALSGVAQAMAQLSQVGGGFGFAAELVAQADVALQSFGKVREGIKEFAKGATADLSAAFASMASGLASGFAGLVGATDPSKDLGDRLLGGAIQGASLGASIGATIGSTIATSAAQGAAYGGVWGAVAGLIIGIMVAVFRGRKARREMEIVGEEWGTSISKGLFDKIAKDQEDLFGGDRVASSLFSFSDILAEAGGLNDLNFDQFTRRLRDVFSMIETGKFTVEQALHVMEENFGAFAQHVIDSGEFAAHGFLEILNLNIASGLNSPEIQQFILGRAGAVGSGLAAMLGPVIEGAAQVGDRVRTAFKAVDDLIKNGKKGTSEYEAAVAELNEALRHQREVAGGAIGDLENIGVIALATFARAREAGLSFVEALNEIGPSLDALIQAQRDLGIEGTNSAINQLMHYRELANQFPALVNAAAALGPTLVALQQMGGLTAESLAAIEDQGMRTFNRLIDAGFTENEALAQMADFLKNVEKAHKQLGIPIDENTQRMIDQARAAGLMGDEAVDATTQQRRGFEMVTRAINALIVTLGGVPIAIDDISKALDDLPDTVEVDVEVNYPDDFPRPPGTTPTPRPPAPDEGGDGGGTPTFTPGGPPGWNAEAVGRATASAQAAAGQYTTQTVVIQVDGEVLTRTVVEGMPDYVRLRAGEAGQ